MVADVKRGLRRAAGALLPPIVSRWLRPPISPVSFSGAYASFSEAERAAGSSGYQDPGYISRALTGTADFRARLAREPEVELEPRMMQVLAAFLLALERPNGQPVRVLDFGGGVGSYFFVLAPLLARRWNVEWTVCEQPALAAAGAQAFGSQIRFVTALDQLGSERFDVAFASGSLQYLPEPAVTCDALLARSDALVINRTPFIPSAADRLTVQQVRMADGLMRCPAWFFSRDGWWSRIRRSGSRIDLSWPSPEDHAVLDGQGVGYAGFLARRG